MGLSRRSPAGRTWIPILGPWLVMSALQAAGAQPRFQASFVAYPVQGEARLANGADLDGDGRQDLIVVSNNTLTVLRAEGGAFVAHDVVGLADVPHSMDVVDADQDGDLDLVTVQFRENAIRVYEQTSPG